MPLLKQANLKDIFDEIVENLKINPYKEYRNFEKLHPYNRYIYSLRINGQHRVVFTIDKRQRRVKIWSA
ncbi:Txe/YoeB family addiction module toxin [Lactobacillus crispatus]|uniref:Txe/YoeB family addiction module toxin n=1 Tax=Lactobacillus crispatus TaxID=47770 RepID=UPI001E5EE86E|nr:Txe/YoeB family addiction module toxin [Lactobacillus crispatus]